MIILERLKNSANFRFIIDRDESYLLFITSYKNGRKNDIWIEYYWLSIFYYFKCKYLANYIDFINIYIYILKNNNINYYLWE